MKKLTILEQIKDHTKEMVRLEYLMVTDSNFRFIYERSFEMFFRLRQELINKLHKKYSEKYEFENNFLTL